MIIHRLKIPDIIEIIPQKHNDARGFFSEIFSQGRLREEGISLDWMQENESYSHKKGTLRGLHYQCPPAAQDKLVRVVRGAVFDVAVDLRRGSPTFGHWVSLVLSVANWNQILIPKGFAHGFLTLEPDTEVVYKVSAPYSPAHDRSIRYDDPAIGINWPLDNQKPILSEKDSMAPSLAESDFGFFYQ